MRRGLAAAIVLTLLTPAAADAHRLDEYLQAARVSLARDRIVVELDVTPGATLAADVVAQIDRDHDDAISPIEASAYAQSVLASLVVELDGRSVEMTLTRVEAPTIGEMRAGLGTIQLRAAGKVESVGPGRRRLYFRNDHRLGASAYLVNALLPEDEDFRIAEQSRDPRQHSLRVEYDVTAAWPLKLLWLMLAAAGLPALFVVRRGDRATTG
jgi:hypothetical protein